MSELAKKHDDEQPWIEDLLAEEAAGAGGAVELGEAVALEAEAQDVAGVDRSSPEKTVRLDALPDPGRLYAAALARSARLAVGPSGPGGGLAGAMGLGGWVGRRRGEVARVPDVALEVSGARLDQQRLDSYRAVVGDRVGGLAGAESTPPGFVHVCLFGMQLALMSRPDFPLPMLGLVHIANRIEQLRPVWCDESLDVRTWARALALRPLGSGGDLGTQVELVTEVRVDGGVAWQGVSTYLAKGTALAGLPVEPREERETFAPPIPTGGWEATREQSKEYARVSGDRNPIHTSGLAAKAFGFPRTIAHGMDTAARALAALGPVRGDAFTWRVDFASPVLVPGRVALRVAPADDSVRGGWDMTAWSPRRSALNLRATLRPA